MVHVGDTRPTILIVDDNADTRESLHYFLEGCGYGVVEATTGRDTLDKLQGGTRPCVILLDLLMPEMDGFQFRKAQLRDPEWAAIPVIAYSALHQFAANATRLAADAYLTKPFELNALRDLIEAHRTKLC